LGFLLPALIFVVGYLDHAQHRPRLSGPEGGFEQYGFAMASLTYVGVVVLVTFLIALYPFRRIASLLLATSWPALIGILCSLSIR
tara:strand:- start:219 stop:473 length:255 start_codon:yes stop_codon:yes gene_type:complete